jgi:hypothetical protein
MPLWQYDPTRRQYQRRDTGEWLSLAALLLLKQRFLDHLEQEARRICARLADGSMSLTGWEVEMQAAVVTGFTAMALLGRGGRRSMTPQDVSPIAAAIQHQFDYLGAFKGQIANGEVTPRALAARASLYPAGAGAAFERGRAQAYGVPGLRQYPGDGQTPCLGRCHCTVDIDEHEDRWEVYWKLGAADHCSGCLDQAEAWSPLVVWR